MATLDDLIVEAWSHWDDAEKLAQLGRELQNRNRLPRAREVLGRAVEIDPARIEAWEYLSYAWLRDYGNEEGMQVLRDGIEATGSDRLRALLAEFTEDEGERERIHEGLADCEDPRVRANLLYSKFYITGQVEHLDALRALSEEHPEVPELSEALLWTLLGAVRKGTVDKEAFRAEALPIADARIAARPAASGPHGLKLMVLKVAEDWEAVLPATAEALQLFPDDESFMHWRGKAFEETGDLDRAAHWFARAIGAKPSFAGARVDLGKVFERRERFDLAEDLFREIPVANPSYPGGPLSLALFLARRDRTDEAEPLFLEAWPKLPPWMQGGVRQNPDAAALLERPAVKELVGGGEE